MDKLKMHTPDVAAANIERLDELFPACVTESRGAVPCLRSNAHFAMDDRHEDKDINTSRPVAEYVLDIPRTKPGHQGTKKAHF